MLSASSNTHSRYFDIAHPRRPTVLKDKEKLLHQGDDLEKTASSSKSANLNLGTLQMVDKRVQT